MRRPFHAPHPFSFTHCFLRHIFPSFNRTKPVNCQSTDIFLNSRRTANDSDTIHPLSKITRPVTLCFARDEKKRQQEETRRKKEKERTENKRLGGSYFIHFGLWTPIMTCELAFRFPFKSQLGARGLEKLPAFVDNNKTHWSSPSTPLPPRDCPRSTALFGGRKRIFAAKGEDEE